MSAPHATILSDRGVIAVGGPDARTFLQGLVSNDVTRVEPGHAIYAALLTPQGKVMFDFFIAADRERLLIDCERARAGDLLKRLQLYKLRAKIELTNLSDTHAVVAAWNGDVPQGDFADPRLTALGRRAIRANEDAVRLVGAKSATAEDYDRHRLSLGVPDGPRDIPPETMFLLDANAEELNGVDFKKGCYVGQELTARMKHRGTARKRMLPVRIDGAMPAPGTAIVGPDGTEVGEIRSGRDGRAIAALRLDRAAAAATLSAGGATVTLEQPAYALTAPAA